MYRFLSVGLHSKYFDQSLFIQIIKIQNHKRIHLQKTLL